MESFPSDYLLDWDVPIVSPVLRKNEFISHEKVYDDFLFLNTFLLARNQSVLTPFWNAIEWIWIILFLLRSKVSRRCRSQKIPSGTDVSEFPDKSRVFRDVANVWRSSLRSSDIWLSGIC